MVEFPPLAPSVRWFFRFFDAWSKGVSEDEAIVIANSGILSLKDFGRYVIRNQKGENLVLSLAVEGGGKQLRYIDKLPGLILSEHGDWRKVHAGAWEAELSRKPYFRYLEPELKKTYEDLKIVRLEDFNNAIFKTLLSFLLGNLNSSDLCRYAKGRNWQDRGREVVESLNPDLSIIQALATHGKETILGIMMADYN